MSPRRPPGSTDRSRSGESSATSPSPDRAQTTTDYAVGAGIFLLAVAFVFTFVPGMLDPFVAGADQDRAVVADRVATELSAGLLGDPADPYTLNTTCTLAFFEQVNNGTDAPSTCRYNTSADTIGGAVGVHDLDHANVTLERNVSGDWATEIVCRDAGSVVECSGDTPLAAGNAPPDTASVVTAQRSVEIDGTQYTMYVRVW